MDAPPIPFSTTDLERQRLESTLDNDLSSLSLTVSNSAPSTSFSSSSSVSTLGVARSAPAVQYRAPDDTPRPHRNPSFAASFASAGVGASPASTAGHHVSAATLGAGVFRRPGAGGNGAERTADEFDPDRSLGRLVGELAKAMGEDRMNKPASPFHRPHSPRSPSPAPASLPNLSFSFNRNDPLPSPPQSRTVSAASSKSTGSRGSNKAAQNAPARSPLGETTRHNLYVPTHLPIPPVGKKPARVPGLGAPGRRADVTADLTGMTGITGITQLLDTPAKGIQFDSIEKNAAPETAGQNFPAALSSLHARIRALQDENGVANHRIRELEAECARARDEIVDMQRNSDRRLNEVESEKRALEELVESLRAHLARVTAELESHKVILAELRRTRDGDTSVRDDLADVKREVARLSREVARLNEVAEKGLLARSHAREQRSVRIAALDLADEELDRVRRDVEERANVLRDTHSAATQTDYALPSQLRQGLHAAAAREAGLMPPSAKPATRVSSDSEGERDAEVGAGPHSPTPASRRSSSRASRHSPVLPDPIPEPEARLARCAASERAERELREGRDPALPAADNTPSRHSIASSTASRRRRRAEGPASPFPSIRAEDEDEFFSPRPSPRPRPQHRATPSRSRPTMAATAEPRQRTGPAPAPMSVRAILEGTGGAVPPVTVLSRVIAELEADFAHYKSIYVELADQYKVLDAASAATKRHVLAEHLKEVIDCLEQKADQIAALYSTMNVSDRPATPAAAPSTTHKSVQELWRCVRDALGEDAVRRLRADGLFRQ